MQSDHVESVKFLERLRPGGPWVLVAIAVDQKRVETRTFRAGPEVAAWLEARSQDNLYYHVNPTTRDLDKKAERTDIRELAWLHVDIDPRVGEDLAAEQARAHDMLRRPPGGLPLPTVIVQSGGGFNALWRLREPLPINGDLAVAEDAKRYNLQLEILFQADSCHNIDRILRLPGTVNWPTAKKRKKGRAPALARVVEWDDSRVYDLRQFAKAPALQRQESTTGFGGPAPLAPGNVRRLGSIEELSDRVPDWCKVLIVQGRDPENPTKYQSRSETLFAVCCGLVRSGVDDETIYAVITDPDFGISESVLDKGRTAERYALRQIERAREEAIAPELRELNERHAVVANYGGKCRVIEEVRDATTGRPRLTSQSFEDFGNRYMNRRVEVGRNKAGLPVHEPLGKWWLSHPMRRQYDRVVFAPGREIEGAYNLWHGFDCEARPGDCSLFLDHVLQNVCGGNESYRDYLINWMATAVQRPDSPGYTAIVLRGRRGTGKSFFAKTFGSLWGRHYLPVSDPKHLVGSFNAHLRDCVVLFGDEAFYAGDRRHESILKTLVTEETISIEAKGLDMEPAKNYLHILMASNDHWVVPAGADERRFFVLDVADSRAQDGAYFGAIQEQLKSGGREALLHLLLTRDLSRFEVRAVPRTRALQEQKELSLDAEAEWWYAKLLAGRLLPTQEGWERVLQDDLQYDYIQHARHFAAPGRRSNATRLGIFLKNMCPRSDRPSPELVKGERPAEATMLDGSRRTVPRPYYFVFPDLAVCRRHWDEKFGGNGSAWSSEKETSGGDASPF